MKNEFYGNEGRRPTAVPHSPGSPTAFLLPGATPGLWVWEIHGPLFFFGGIQHPTTIPGRSAARGVLYSRAAQRGWHRSPARLPGAERKSGDVGKELALASRRILGLERENPGGPWRHGTGWLLVWPSHLLAAEPWGGTAGIGIRRHQHGSGGVPGGSQHAGDHHGEEVLVAEAHVAQQRRVLLAESLGGALQLHADVDEAVELDAGLGRPRGVAGQQQLAELGAEVVAQLGEGWEREGLGLNPPNPKKKKGDSPGSCTPIPTTLQDHRGRNQIKAQIPGMFLSH